MTVLIITHSGDNSSIDTVIGEIRAAGERAFRFDTDAFPTDVRLSLGCTGDVHDLELRSDADVVRLREITAVWFRRVRIGDRIPKDLDAQMRAASVGEARATVLGALSATPAFCMDPWTRIRQAEMKPLQLRVATEVGLRVPRTLTTNDADAVLRFARDCPQGVITKMMTSFAIFEGEAENVVFTNRVGEDDLRDLTGLDLCPMTFQECVEKRLELRVTVVGNRVFTAAVDSNAIAEAGLDWRRRGDDLSDAWQKHVLPADVEAKVLALMDRLHLNYGALDFILTPAGEHVFLEVNPAGEYFWLEDCPGLPISAAIAELLLGRAPRRENRGVV